MPGLQGGEEEGGGPVEDVEGRTGALLPHVPGLQGVEEEGTGPVEDGGVTAPCA